ncbi:histidinol dehydrogenase [Candidatus Woesearchaeota archaeon CG1_02_57_44]|nr:MAG: histidinol dehydrogenase [Candidatus Woesearchaeota archaeon CG1_02_57_44]
MTRKPRLPDRALQTQVRDIIDDVRARGDAAVDEYTLRFDGRKGTDALKPQEIRDAFSSLDRQTLTDLKEAAARIEAFARSQMQAAESLRLSGSGTGSGTTMLPINSVGCYVPGGRYPLPSSALMSVIPARVAGVADITVCTPKPTPATVVAASLAGATRILPIGGAQAIAAMAYGTADIPRVEKIVGPGNAYVTEAKRQVFGEVDIDMLAGPSELMIIADNSAEPSCIAADLLAQAEHDEDAQVWLVATDDEVISEVTRCLERQLTALPDTRVARSAMVKAQVSVVDTDSAVTIANRIAPEHLELQARNAEAMAARCRAYGSLFIGAWSAEVLGDYCAGPNHILPTGGAGAYRGGLSVMDFLAVRTWLRLDERQAREVLPLAERLARVEGLDAHAKAAGRRLRQDP